MINRSGHGLFREVAIKDNLFLGNLKKGTVTNKTLSALFSVLDGTKQQSSVFNDPDSVSIVTELQ